MAGVGIFNAFLRNLPRIGFTAAAGYATVKTINSVNERGLLDTMKKMALVGDKEDVKHPGNFANPITPETKDANAQDITSAEDSWGIEKFLGLFNGSSEFSLEDITKNLNIGNIGMGIAGAWLMFGNTGILGKLIGAFLALTAVGNVCTKQKAAQYQQQNISKDKEQSNTNDKSQDESEEKASQVSRKL